MAIPVFVVDAFTGWVISAMGMYTWFIRGGFHIILGAGIDPNFQALTIAFQSVVKSSDVGTATSTFSFVRNLATSTGLILGEVVFQNVMRGQYNKLSGLSGPRLTGTLANGGAASSVFTVNKLPADQITAARDAYYMEIRDL
ncbi:hypothetical protein HO133_000419 [Letharia lupina]|uniref:Uncharacterized protein n=1 Tax=Letharia lupina TaxID=560253 RepID=A0A8H6CI25_9LECA|nr:uncharacterized protein HO133_000419 [Letharia lupina]KAF6223576.1 hypothetical protein HO133_000419 [Letharia lupina]